VLLAGAWCHPFNAGKDSFSICQQGLPRRAGGLRPRDPHSINPRQTFFVSAQYLAQATLDAVSRHGITHTFADGNPISDV